MQSHSDGYAKKEMLEPETVRLSLFKTKPTSKRIVCINRPDDDGDVRSRFFDEVSNYLLNPFEMSEIDIEDVNTEKAIQKQLEQRLSKKFGTKNVQHEVGLYFATPDEQTYQDGPNRKLKFRLVTPPVARIDLKVFDIGIEINLLSGISSYEQLYGKMVFYREFFGQNLIAMLFWTGKYGNKDLMNLPRGGEPITPQAKKSQEWLYDGKNANQLQIDFWSELFRRDSPKLIYVGLPNID